MIADKVIDGIWEAGAGASSTLLGIGLRERISIEGPRALAISMISSCDKLRDTVVKVQYRWRQSSRSHLEGWVIDGNICRKLEVDVENGKWRTGF